MAYKLPEEHKTSARLMHLKFILIVLLGLICASSQTFSQTRQQLKETHTGVTTSSTTYSILRLEAENATLNPLFIGTDANASNGKYVGGFNATGNNLQWKNVPASSAMTIAYNNGQATTISVYVNGVRITAVAMPSSSKWNTVSLTIDIPSNATVMLQRDATDTQWTNFDYADFTTTGIIDTEAPSIPVGLALSAIKQTSFTLSWTASTDNVGVASYQVFDGAVSKGITTTTSLLISGMICNTDHTLTVKATDAAGNVSVSSGVLNAATSACVADIQAPTIPAVLTATNITETSFTLSWAASTDDVEVTAYDILLNGSVIGTTTSTSFNVTERSGSTTYITTVRAKDAAGNVSDASTPLNVTTTSILLTSTPHYVGINLSWVNDWTNDRIFADVWRTSREEWHRGTTWGDPNPRANIDANGWPMEDACVLLWSSANMNGTYALSFSGQATVTTGMNGAAVSNMVYNPTTNTSTATFIPYIRTTASQTIAVNFKDTKLTATSATNTGVTNIKLMRPTTVGGSTPYPETTTFTNEIKTFLSKFQAFRTMDPFNTNSSKTVNWSDRNLTTYCTQSRRCGVSWEYMIQLANETGKDIWINIPHKATDDFVTQCATLFKNTLNPNIKVYIEFSNEMWNTASGFSQGNEITGFATAEINAGGSNLNYDVADNPQNQWVYGYRWAGRRAMQVSNIFRSVCGDAAMMTQIRPVFEWQMGGGLGSPALEFLNAYYNSSTYVATPHPVSYFFYGGGGSGYYNPDNSSNTLTIDNIWTNGSYAPSGFVGTLKTDADLCATYGIRRIAYEGGPSMDNLGHSEAVKAQAWSDPRMTGLVTDHQNIWDQNSGDLLMYYVSTGGGDYQWAFTTNTTNWNTPKCAAIDLINSVNKAAITYRTEVPATIDATNTAIVSGNIYNGGSHNLCLRANKSMGSWAAYTFRVTTAGTYNVSCQINSGWSYTGTLKISCEGVLLGTENLTIPGYTTATYTLNLQPGLHSVKFFNPGTTEISLTNIYIKAGAGTKNNGPTTTVDNTTNHFISLYPNPVKGNSFTIDLKGMNGNDKLQVSIVDLTGKPVYKTVTNQRENLIISTDGFAKGIYLVSIIGGDISANTKLVVE